MSNPGDHAIDAMLAGMKPAFIRAALLQTWSQAITEWQAAVFGPVTPAAALRRADQEWGELRYQPSPEEAADVVICLAAYVKACGGDLAAAVADKLAVCKTRTWVQDADGSWRHV